MAGTSHYRPDPDDPWVERPEEEINQKVDISPPNTDTEEFRRTHFIPFINKRAPRAVVILLIDVIPVFVAMIVAGLLGACATLIGSPGDADPTGALYVLYGIQATLIVSVAFLPKTVDQLTHGIIQILVILTSVIGIGYTGFHFMWFGEELGLVIAIFHAIFTLAFSTLAIAFAYSSRYWRALARKKEDKVLKKSTAWTRWRLRRANLQAYREWCWRHEEEPEHFEELLWRSGAFALTFDELQEAQHSKPLDDLLDTREGIEMKDSSHGMSE